MSRRGNYLALACLWIAAMCLPIFMKNDYYLAILVMVAINTIVVIGLVLLMGFAGQVSMGHAAFYGLGAYGSSVLSATYHWPVPLSFGAAVVGTGVVAYIIGRPALKLKGHYLAMATLALGEIVHICFNEMDKITGGPSGLSGIPRMRVGDFVFHSDRSYYQLVWSVLALIVLLSLNLTNSRPGRGLRAIHGGEKAALAMGVDVPAYKTSIFVVSALWAAVAGGLYAHFITFISPSSFGIGASVLLVTMAAVGGMESVWGGLVGAGILTILPEYLRFFRDYDILMYGIILMVIMIFLPRGLVVGLPPLLGRLWRRDHASS